MRLPFDDVRCSPHASSNAGYFFLADVKCGLYEINKNKRANATHGSGRVEKMSGDRTETMLDCGGPRPGAVLTLG